LQLHPSELPHSEGGGGGGGDDDNYDDDDIAPQIFAPFHIH